MRRAERKARNEALVRSINEQLKLHYEESHGDGNRPTPSQFFVCECADLDCVEECPATIEDYVQVRSHPARFLVRPGHTDMTVEQVVIENEHYAVVEKFGEAGAIAEERAD